MLIRASIVGLCLLASAPPADARLPSLESAFGIPFGEPLEPAILGATLDLPPLPESHVKVLRAAVETEEHALTTGWHHIAPDQLPRILKSAPVDYYLQRDAEGQAVTVLASLKTDCPELSTKLAGLLERKYKSEAESLVIAPAFSSLQRWPLNEAFIVLGCEARRGWLAYISTTAAMAVHRSHQPVHANAEELRRKGLVIRADRFAHGNRRALDGAFGVMFGARFADAERLPVDEPAAVEIEPPAPEYGSADFSVTLAPTGEPIRIAALYTPDKRPHTFNDLADMLEAKFGTPSKRTRKHIIHKVGNDFAVLKAPRIGSVELVFIDGFAQKAMRARAKEAKDRDWQKEVDGL